MVWSCTNNKAGWIVCLDSRSDRAVRGQVVGAVTVYLLKSMARGVVVCRSRWMW